MPSRALRWPLRAALGAWSVGGTALFAWSHTLPGPTVLSAGTMETVALGAGVAWLVFGCCLELFGRGAGRMAWADACLRTMGTGMIFISLCAAIRILDLPLGARAQLVLILAGDAAMSFHFRAETAGMGIPRLRAWSLWVLGLQAPFLAFLLLRGAG